MKYLKLFDTHSDYTDFINTEIDKPNVSYCLDAKDIHFNPIKVESVFTAKFDVEDATNPTPLYFYLSRQGTSFEILGVNMFDKVEVDGTEVSVADLDTNHGGYQLSVGEHTVEYTLKDPTLIGAIFDEQAGTLISYGIIFDDIDSLTSVTIPSSVTTIGYNAFGRCSGLTSITIPNSVTSIGEGAFSGCTGLTSITIPNSVTSIGEGAFSGCSGLTSITIPNGVTSISEGAFAFCSSLTSVEIPNSVTSISDGAFGGCTGLTSVGPVGSNAGVKIPNSVTSIGTDAFNGCSGLTNINIPNSVTSISDGAFEACSGLTSVTIPSSVVSIGNKAFYGCGSLTSVTCEPTTPPSLATDVFKDTSSSLRIYVECDSVVAYRAASGWDNYSSKIFSADENCENNTVINA